MGHNGRMKSLTIWIAVLLMMSLVGCKDEAPSAPPAPEKVETGPTCEGVFSNLLRLCREHPQCQPTVGEMRKHRSSFITDCKKGADPNRLLCASQAKTMVEFTDCSQINPVNTPAASP